MIDRQQYNVYVKIAGYVCMQMDWDDQDCTSTSLASSESGSPWGREGSASFWGDNAANLP